jgi:glyoxylase-like metal-dependent hydrolase (beta-lactamase superfamily II)
MHLDHGFYTVEIPIPAPLKTVNCYLSKSEAGWHLIDTGFHTEEAEAAWKQAFAELRIAPRDVAEIVLTHFHPDHSGMAGWLQDYTNAPVKISGTGKEVIRRLWMEGGEAALFDGFAYEHGMLPKERERVLGYLEHFHKFVTPFPELTAFEEGTFFHWSEEYEAIETPGHADGHMIFYSADSRTVVAGDLLLPKITPNIGWFPIFHANPLQAFFDSLHKIQRYDLETVLSGHRHVYRDGNKRAFELIAHHEDRLREITALMDEPCTAQQISRKLFSHLGEGAEPLQLLFALEETLSHLVYLREQGFVNSVKNGEGVVFFNLEQPFTQQGRVGIHE